MTSRRDYTGQQAVNMVIARVRGDTSHPEAFAFNELLTRPNRAALGNTLAQQYDDSQNDWGKILRRGAGSDNRAKSAVEDNDTGIEAAVNPPSGIHPLPSRPNGAPDVIDANFIRSIMYLENYYNPGGTNRTVLPMNVNYTMWHEVLAHHGLTLEDMDNPGKNIRAASIILHYIDASIPASISDPSERRMLMASMYGSTEHTLEAGRPIMYGGKVQQIYAESAFQRDERSQLASLETEPRLMELIPPSLRLPAMPSRNETFLG
jgi:hypothetical protein